METKFRAEKAEIYTMPVWVRFPVLPLEYYTERWLRIARNHIGKTIKIDIATLLASHGRFARVCVEVDLKKPLMAGYVMRREYYILQYEGLHDLCFGSGRYGHRDATCPEKQTEKDTMGNGLTKEHMASEAQPGSSTLEAEGPVYGEWATVQRNRRRPPDASKGKTVN